MKVGVLPPFIYTIPPQGYGGEIQVWDLCEPLGRLGVEVHLFALPNSRCPPNGVLHYVPRSTWHDFWLKEQYPVRFYRRILLDLDVVHDWTHSHFTHDFFRDRLDKRNVVSTPWGTAIPRPFYRERLVVWSRFHRECALQQGWPATTKIVHGGVNTDFYCPGESEKDDYFLWFARWHPTKRPEFTMDLAKETGISLVMSGSSEESPDHQYYFQQYSEKAKDYENVRIVKMPLDETHHAFKRELYRGAKALILPYFQEAFGLITCEALSCGTPVIGSDEGALPEIIKRGETGFLCKTDQDYVNAVRNVDSLSPEACREDAVKRWNRERVAREYLEVYEAVADGEVF